MSQQINLYQPIFRKQKRKFSAMAMLQATGLVVAGVVIMAGYSEWQISHLRSELKKAEAQHATATQRLSELTQRLGARPVRASLDEQIKHLEQEIAAKERVKQILQRGVFSNTFGFSDYFVAFARQHVPGVWLTGFDITGAADQISIQGRSTHPEMVPRFMQRLSSEKRLTGIEFYVFQINRADPPKTPYVEFVLTTSSTLPAKP